jgi:hypothetical protein
LIFGEDCGKFWLGFVTVVRSRRGSNVLEAVSEHKVELGERVLYRTGYKTVTTSFLDWLEARTWSC